MQHDIECGNDGDNCECMLDECESGGSALCPNCNRFKYYCEPRVVGDKLVFMFVCYDCGFMSPAENQCLAG